MRARGTKAPAGWPQRPDSDFSYTTVKSKVITLDFHQGIKEISVCPGVNQNYSKFLQIDTNITKWEGNAVPTFQPSLHACDTADHRGHSPSKDPTPQPRVTASKPFCLPAEEGVVGKAAQKKAGEKGSSRQPEHSFGAEVHKSPTTHGAALWAAGSTWNAKGAQPGSPLEHPVRQQLRVASVCASQQGAHQ